MKHLKSIGTLLLFTSVVACTPKFTEDQKAKIEKLETRINAAFDEINSIDTSRAYATASHFSDNISYLKFKMKDTIAPDMALLVDRYYSTRKAFSLFQTSYIPNLNEIKSLKTQIENLSHDADAGILEEVQFEKYLQVESNNVALAEESLNQLSFAINTVLPIYDSLNPIIDSLIAVSKSKMSPDSE